MISRSGYVYFLVTENYAYTKIGRTSELGNRIKTLSIQLPFKVDLRHVIRTDDAHWLESLFHREWCRWRVNGEWFGTIGKPLWEGLMGRWIDVDYWDSGLERTRQLRKKQIESEIRETNPYFPDWMDPEEPTHKDYAELIWAREGQRKWQS